MTSPRSSAPAEPALIESSEGPQLSRTQMNMVFVTVLFGMLLSALDQTIVSTALPTIVGDLGSAGHMSWVVTAYLLTQTVSTALAGKFGDLFGRKKVFLISVVVFILGSFLCGLAVNMEMLIASRALQGIGGGGLMVTAMALIGEVIPLRERGKYQGALGGVFGVTTVIGPLLGGFFTDNLSWRWAFYVNVPIAIIVVLLALRTIPGRGRTASPKVDYAGVMLVGLGATGLTLATSWGGTQYAWGSAVIIGLFVASAIVLAAFVWLESRAAEPILPLRLFRNRVFAVSSVLSFIVGFAMVGSITYLPVFLQFVGGVSATGSGVRTLPMVLGLLLTSVLSGTVVGRTRQYKIFPVVGSVVIGIGLYLLSTMDANTPIWQQSLYLFVLGTGIGSSMQVLTIIVQNTVTLSDLGAATSGITFFRTLGSSFGASVMGSLYSNDLQSRLPEALAAAGVDPSAVATPQALHRLPEYVRAPLIDVYATSIQHIFLWALPVAVVAFLFALILPQVAMRTGSAKAAGEPGAGFAIPKSDNAADTLEDLVCRSITSTGGPSLDEVMRRSAVQGDLAQLWGIMQVGVADKIFGRQSTRRRIEERIGVPPGVLDSYFDGLVSAGLITGASTDDLHLAERGQVEFDALYRTWREIILEDIREWLTDGDDPGPELDEAISSVVTRLLREDLQARREVRMRHSRVLGPPAEKTPEIEASAADR